MKLKGNALYYSIIIILISSSTVGLILLGSFYQSRILTNTIIKDQLENNLSSSFNLVKGGEILFQENNNLFIDIFQDSINKVELTKKLWGSYSIIKATTRINNYQLSKRALVGSDLDYEEQVALFVVDEGSFLSLSGSTLIKGLSYLPQKIARSASIEGQPFIYKNLISGIINRSLKIIPTVQEEIFEFAESYLLDGLSEGDSIINIKSIESKALINSFENQTLVIICDNLMDLSGYSFEGNIILWSVHPIIIKETTHLTDIVLFAPSVIIKDGFSGAFQAYALQSVDVGKNCKLNFPTILSVIQSENRYSQSDSLKIIVGHNSIIHGGILIKSNGLKSYLRIDEGTKVTGQVYIPGAIELKGDVIGSVYCRSFYLQTSKARYANHLLNCEINREALPTCFVGLDLFKSNPYKSIIEWLN